MSVGRIIAIASWVLDKYDTIKEWAVKKYRIWKTRRVRKMVDDGNVDAVESIVRDIKRKRKERHDAS